MIVDTESSQPAECYLNNGAGPFTDVSDLLNKMLRGTIFREVAVLSGIIEREPAGGNMRGRAAWPFRPILIGMGMWIFIC